MIKKVLFIAAGLCLLASGPSMAQKTGKKKSAKPGKNQIVARSKDGKEVIVTIVDDDPSNVSNLFLGIDPIGVEVSTGFNMGAQLAGTYWDKEKKWMGSARIFMPYLESEYMEVADRENTSQLGFVRALNMELNGTYFFASTRKTTPTMIALGGSTEGATPVSYTLKLDARRDWNYGVRGGYAFFRQSLAHSEQPLDTSNGIRMAAYGSHILHLGFTLMPVRHVVVETDDFGRKGRNFVRQWYVDALFLAAATSNLYDTKPYPNVPVDASLGSNYPKNYIGWRLGVETYMFADKHITLHTTFECGSNPGYKGITGGFFLAKFGLAFNKATD